MTVDRQLVLDLNPKDRIGDRKVPFHVIPANVIAEVGLAMLEGALKYGSHNYRAIGVRASVYYNAVRRHMDAWWEGEDQDPDSDLSHITKAIASLVVLRDAMLNEKMLDDRPPSLVEGWVNEYNKQAAKLINKYPSPMEAHTKKNDTDSTTPDTLRSQPFYFQGDPFVKVPNSG